ncbi:MAG: DUF2937 family protein [Burkholderiales bacterium]|nr:MAG: DUF2937 family protein [Burkholderiales bacterium]
MRRTVAMIGGVALAVVLSQFPEYAQQYTQRLGGAVDELRIVTEDFDRAAVSGGLSRAQALERYNASNDDFLAGRGTSMTATFQRFEQLSNTLAEVQGAGPYERFQSLPFYFDTDIGRRTLESFKPAVPVTLEGFAYAGAGFVLGYLVLSALWRLCALPFKRRRYAYKY